MSFQFQLPTAIYFDTVAADTVAAIVGRRRAVLICSTGFLARRSDDAFRASLGDSLTAVVAGAPSNPSVRSVCSLAQEVAEADPEVLVAIGGGSVIDAAKGIAAVNSEDCREPAELLSLLRAGGKMRSPQVLPVIAVPTTSGTGSEVTSFATIWDDENHQKFSVHGPQNAPEAAVLDPALTLTLPENDTVSTGLDAISQGLESLWNKHSNPVTQSWAAEAIKVSLSALPALLRDLSDLGARRDMMLGSLLSGLAISQTRTGIAHAMSYPLTAHYGTPHGIACSFTLAAILKKNVAQDDGRFQFLAQYLGLNDTDQLNGVIQSTLNDTGVLSRLAQTVSTPDCVVEKFDEMFAVGRADNNFAALSRHEIMNILVDSLEGFPMNPKIK